MNKNRRYTNHSGIHKVTRLSKCKTCTHINRTLVLNPLPFTEILTNIRLPTTLNPWGQSTANIFPKILTEGTKRPLLAPHRLNTCKGVTHKCRISFFLV